MITPGNNDDYDQNDDPLGLNPGPNPSQCLGHALERTIREHAQQYQMTDGEVVYVLNMLLFQVLQLCSKK